MTGLNNASTVVFTPYPALEEMKRLFPDSLPNELEARLVPVARSWQEMLEKIDFESDRVDLRNEFGDLATVTGLARTKKSTLTIKMKDKPMFKASYDSVITSLHQAFESGYCKVL
jgi:hypothetical protein